MPYCLRQEKPSRGQTLIVFHNEALFQVGVTKAVERVQIGCEIIKVECDPVWLARLGGSLDFARELRGTTDQRDFLIAQLRDSIDRREIPSSSKALRSVD